MMTLYVVCLVFGGIFIVVTLLFGSDADGDLDFDGDVDMDADLDVDGDIDVVEGEGVTEAIKFFSFRTFVFFSAFFGLTGVVFTWLNIFPLLTFAMAMLIGIFAATLMYKTLAHLMQNEVEGTINLDSLVGMSARVILDLSKQQRGKIAVEVQGNLLQLLAKIAEEAERDSFRQGDTVIVLRVQDGTAFVVENEFVQA